MKRSTRFRRDGKRPPLYEIVIERLCSTLGLPSGVAFRAIELAKKYFSVSGGGGVSYVASVAAGAVYLACLESGLDPRSWELERELRKLLGGDLKLNIPRFARAIADRLGMDLASLVKRVSIEERVARALNSLANEVEFQVIARALTHVRELLRVLEGAKPRTVAAVAIALAAAETGRDPYEEARRVAERLGISVKNVFRWIDRLGIYRVYEARKR